jgi:hypothetical protein
LTPGDVLYIGATAGRLDTAPTAGDIEGVAQVITSTDIRVLRDAPAKSANGLVKQAVVAGGSAGNITVTGIATVDRLVSVIRFVGGGTDVTDVTNLTSEFSITAADTISNSGGTATTGSKLLVTYLDLG